MPRRPRPLDEVAAAAEPMRALKRRVELLEIPDGNQLNRALEKVLQLIDDLPSQVAAATTAYLSGGFTTGSVTATGDVSVGGSVSAGATVSAATVTGELHGLNITTNITAARVALWGRTSDGFVATATSSERFKTAVRAVDVEEKARAVLQIVVSYFEYVDEVRRRDDPSYEHYVGPDYHVATNMGGIAEQMHELGLWEWVVYERELEVLADEEGNPLRDEQGRPTIVGERLKLDEHGEPIPYGIHDSLIGWAALLVAQYEWKVLERHKSRLERIEAALGLTVDEA